MSWDRDHRSHGGRVSRAVTAQATHGGFKSIPSQERAHPTIDTEHPRCPECRAEMLLMRDTIETLRGAPRTWWCPEDASVLRRLGHGQWRRMVLTEDGNIVPYPEMPEVRTSGC